MRARFVLGLLPLLAAGSFASAEPKNAPVKTAKTESTVKCALSGVARLPVNTAITDAAGRTLARFSGSEVALSVIELTRATPVKALIETGTGRGSFRVRGFVDAATLPVFGVRDLAVVPGHVFLSARRRLTIVGAEPDRLKVERRLSAPFQQTLSTWAPCSALELSERAARPSKEGKAPAGYMPEGDARGYVLRRTSLELFDADAAARHPVTELHRAPDADGVLFFGRETQAGFVHIEHRGEIVIDAWARLTDLEALPRGEIMDQVATPSSTRTPPRLAVQGEPRTVRSVHSVPLRSAASATASVIGEIEPETDTYVLDVIAGWASVMPKSLTVVPAENAQFWVKASDLGI
jgi:hypothetical protein